TRSSSAGILATAWRCAGEDPLFPEGLSHSQEILAKCLADIGLRPAALQQPVGDLRQLYRLGYLQMLAIAFARRPEIRIEVCEVVERIVGHRRRIIEADADMIGTDEVGDITKAVDHGLGRRLAIGQEETDPIDADDAAGARAGPDLFIDDVAPMQAQGLG